MLRIRGLFKRHGEREVLRGVSLSVGAGQVGVLIGPSGSGKSTLLRCVNGLDTFESGEITVAEETLTADILARSAERELQSIRRRVGMVFQQFNLFPHLSVLGNVIEAPVHVLGLTRDEAAHEATELLRRVGLGDRLESFPGQLSGGEQQRVAIARALAMRPQIVLFDEPTSSLDPKMTSEVLSVMGELAADGQTMLVVTHAMEFARRVANEVHVISDGVIVESGPPVQVLDYPRHPQSRELLRQTEQEWVRRLSSA